MTEHTNLDRIDAGTIPSYGNANTTADSSNNEPVYKTVLFIQYAYEAGSGALIQALS